MTYITRWEGLHLGCYIEQPNLEIEAGHMFTTNNQKQLNKVYAHYRQPNIGVREIELKNSYSTVRRTCRRQVVIVNET